MPFVDLSFLFIVYSFLDLLIICMYFVLDEIGSLFIFVYVFEYEMNFINRLLYIPLKNVNLYFSVFSWIYYVYFYLDAQ